jgi:hypothetical protein
MVQRAKWLYEEAYGVIKATPRELIQELQNDGIIRQQLMLDGTQSTRISYHVAGLAWKSAEDVSRFWTVPSLQFMVEGVSYDRSYCDTISRNSISEWMVKLGCTVVFNGMNAVVTAHPSRAKLLAHELPKVLQLLISVEPAFLLDCRFELKDIRKLLGENGARMKELQTKHQVRLTISGQKMGGWLSPDVLPQEFTCADLCGLSQKLKKQMRIAKSSLERALQPSENVLQFSSNNECQAEQGSGTDEVEVAVTTQAGEEVMRKRLLRCTPCVSLRRQLEAEFEGRRAQIFFNDRKLLDRDTFEKGDNILSDSEILCMQVVFTEKTDKQIVQEKHSEIWRQLQEINRNIRRIRTDLRASKRHRDRFRTNSNIDALEYYVLQKDRATIQLQQCEADLRDMRQP